MPSRIGFFGGGSDQQSWEMEYFMAHFMHISPAPKEVWRPIEPSQ